MCSYEGGSNEVGNKGQERGQDRARSKDEGPRFTGHSQEFLSLLSRVCFRLHACLCACDDIARGCVVDDISVA